MPTRLALRYGMESPPKANMSNPIDDAEDEAAIAANNAHDGLYEMGIGAEAAAITVPDDPNPPLPDGGPTDGIHGTDH